MENRTVNSEPLTAFILHRKGAKLGLPISGAFELTSRCNFNCKMCYVHAQDAAEAEKSELTAKQWLEIGERARDAGMVFLLLTGGEPLLRPDFEEIYCGLKKMGLVVSVNTNGSLISGRIAELFLKNPPYRLNITLYGGKNETYQRLCRNAAFDRVSANIEKLVSHGIQVRLNCSVTPENFGDMEEIFAFSKRLGLNVKATTYMYPKLRADAEAFGKNDCRFSPEDAAKYRIRWNKIRLGADGFKTNAEKFAAGVKEGGDCGLLPESGSGMRCRAGRSSFWINCRGEMTACGIAPFAAESVTGLGFDESWRRVRESTEKIRLPKECGVCRFKEVCSVCAAMCRCETGAFDKKPEYICRMTEETARLSAEEAAKAKAAKSVEESL